MRKFENFLIRRSNFKRYQPSDIKGKAEKKDQTSK